MKRVQVTRPPTVLYLDTSPLHLAFQEDGASMFSPFACIFRESILLLIMKMIAKGRDGTTKYLEERLFWNMSTFESYLRMLSNIKDKNNNDHSSSIKFDTFERTLDEISSKMPIDYKENIFSGFASVGIDISYATRFYEEIIGKYIGAKISIEIGIGKNTKSSDKQAILFYNDCVYFSSMICKGIDDFIRRHSAFNNMRKLEDSFKADYIPNNLKKGFIFDEYDTIVDMISDAPKDKMDMLRNVCGMKLVYENGSVRHLSALEWREFHKNEYKIGEKDQYYNMAYYPYSLDKAQEIKSQYNGINFKPEGPFGPIVLPRFEWHSEFSRNPVQEIYRNYLKSFFEPFNVLFIEAVSLALFESLIKYNPVAKNFIDEMYYWNMETAYSYFELIKPFDNPNDPFKMYAEYVNHIRMLIKGEGYHSSLGWQFYPYSYERRFSLLPLHGVYNVNAERRVRQRGENGNDNANQINTPGDFTSIIRGIELEQEILITVVRNVASSFPIEDVKYGSIDGIAGGSGVEDRPIELRAGISNVGHSKVWRCAMSLSSIISSRTLLFRNTFEMDNWLGSKSIKIIKQDFMTKLLEEIRRETIMRIRKLYDGDEVFIVYEDENSTSMSYKDFVRETVRLGNMNNPAIAPFEEDYAPETGRKRKGVDALLEALLSNGLDITKTESKNRINDEIRKLTHEDMSYLISELTNLSVSNKDKSKKIELNSIRRTVQTIFMQNSAS